MSNSFNSISRALAFMGVGEGFISRGVNGAFSRGNQKDFSRGGHKWWKFIL